MKTLAKLEMHLVEQWVAAQAKHSVGPHVEHQLTLQAKPEMPLVEQLIAAQAKPSMVTSVEQAKPEMP